MNSAARGKMVTCTCVLLSLAGVLGAQQRLLTGNEAGLWLVVPDTDKQTHQVLVRPTGRAWTWVTDDIGPGTPVSAAAVGSRLHLLNRDPFGYLIFSDKPGRPETGRNPADARWVADVQPPLAVCEAVDFAGFAPPTILAIVPHAGGPATAATQPATPANQSSARTPTTAAAGAPVRLVDLAVFQKVAEEWTYLTELPGVRLTGQSRVLAAVADGTLYVLICHPGRNHLAAWDGKEWRDVALQGAPASAGVLVMTSLRSGREQGKDRLVLVLREPVEPEKLRLQVATYDAPEGRFSLQSIAGADGAPQTWDASSPPQAARLAGQLAFLWRDGEALKLTLWDPAQRILYTEEVDILRRGPSERGGREVLTYFQHGILIAILLATIVLRPRGMPKPFSLAPGLRPAHLGKRLLALLLDLIPFGFIAGIVFPLPAAVEEVSNWNQLVQFLKLHWYSAPAAYGFVLSLLLFTAYCIFMEARFGATLGKKLLKLHVVGDEGRPLDARAATLRNLWRLFELTWPVLLLAVLLNRHRRRLGELLSRTAVVEGTASAPPQDQTGDRQGPPDP